MHYDVVVFKSKANRDNAEKEKRRYNKPRDHISLPLSRSLSPTHTQAEKTRGLKIRESKQAALTMEEIAPLPESTRCFRSVGKAYILAPKAEVLKELEQTAESSMKDTKQLELLGDKVLASLREAETEMIELQKQLMAANV